MKIRPIQKQTFVVFSVCDFLNDFFWKYLVAALVRSITFNGGLTQFLAKANLTRSNIYWRRKSTTCIYSLPCKTIFEILH